MKILFIHHSGLLGGAGVSLLNVAGALQQKGHEVVVCIPSEPLDMQNMAREKGLRSVITEPRIGAVTCVSGIDRVFSLRFLYRIGLIIKQKSRWNKRIKEINPDIVVVNSKTLCWMGRLSEMRKRRSICFVRETMRGKRTRLANVAIARALDNFAEVAFISEYDKKTENLKRAKTHVIYNYVDNIQYPSTEELVLKQREWGLKQNTFKVLYVGGVTELKGFHIALQAVLSMGEDVELIVAGMDFNDVKNTGNKKAMAYAGQWEAYLASNDSHHQIHLIGKQKNMSYCYSLCDVLLFPMQSAHQARPAFEAGFYGKPVVISDFENIKEFVIDGKNGFTSQADKIDDFVEKLMRLKDNPTLCKTMGNCNQENTFKRHSKEVVQQQIVGMINEE